MNPSNGVLLKKASKIPRKSCSPVASLTYIKDRLHLLAGFGDGSISLYDDAMPEECHLLKTLDAPLFSSSDQEFLHCVAHDIHSHMVLSCDTRAPCVNIWNVSSGKLTGEVRVSEPSEQITRILPLDPYPLILVTGIHCIYRIDGTFLSLLLSMISIFASRFGR